MGFGVCGVGFRVQEVGRRVRGVGLRVGCSVFSVQCSVFSVQYSVFSVQCSVFSISFVFRLSFFCFRGCGCKVGRVPGVGCVEFQASRLGLGLSCRLQGLRVHGFEFRNAG